MTTRAAAVLVVAPHPDDAEFGVAGTVAHWFGPALGNSIAFGAVVSVVSGGVGTILAVLAVAWLWPELRRYGRLDV